MKLNNELAKLLRIPTKGMIPHETVNKQAFWMSMGSCPWLKLTRGFLNQGQLRVEHNGPTRWVCFIQRNDGEIFLQVSDYRENGADYHTVENKLNENINAEIILTNVAPAEFVRRYDEGYLNPKYGALEFLAQHHPRADARVAAIAALMDLNYAETVKELADAQAITS